VEFRFFEPPRETKIGSKSRRVREIGDKITEFDCGDGNDFCFELSGGSKKWGFEKLGFHWLYFALVFQNCTRFWNLHRYYMKTVLMFSQPESSNVFKCIIRRVNSCVHTTLDYAFPEFWLALGHWQSIILDPICTCGKILNIYTWITFDNTSTYTWLTEPIFGSCIRHQVTIRASNHFFKLENWTIIKTNYYNILFKRQPYQTNSTIPGILNRKEFFTDLSIAVLHDGFSKICHVIIICNKRKLESNSGLSLKEKKRHRWRRSCHQYLHLLH